MLEEGVPAAAFDESFARYVSAVNEYVSLLQDAFRPRKATRMLDDQESVFSRVRVKMDEVHNLAQTLKVLTSGIAQNADPHTAWRYEQTARLLFEHRAV